MPEKFKFTQENLDDMVLATLNEEPAKPEGKAAKPNVVKRLLAQAQLGKGKQ